ncbi:hypothetical protein EDC55_11043 [Allofrancisella inopinata]|uniref:DUF541 domain-containing protein n=1 Tax=Allofrancisella inopinata TaxID=1085647 RepID=A0AAE6YIH7_9GAMM|nr:hypothetical protein [Allofrancisella inopinata]QIV96052.1 hypothetical protein E4K63_04095 [Allofrancisella inopinata]TDT71710.1 hypothetical protein EDC55_11043 [Allofrancisella inopinata]
MKKITSTTLISIATMTSLYACDNKDQGKYNTISYTTQAETSVKSDSILVQVTAYATTTLQDINNVQHKITANIKNIIDTDWKVKNIQQSTSQSGALNVTSELQARITQTQLNKLQTALDNQKINGQKLVVDILDYNPPTQDIENAKQKLMIKIYNDTKKYLNNFNKQTDSNYIIQSIKYGPDYNILPSSGNLVLMKTVANNYNDNTNQAAVSKDISIKANVTFIER